MLKAVLEASQASVAGTIALCWAVLQETQRVLKNRRAYVAHTTGEACPAGQRVVDVDLSFQPFVAARRECRAVFGLQLACFNLKALSVGNGQRLRQCA